MKAGERAVCLTMREGPACAVLLSGGVDSALVTALLCRTSLKVEAVWVDYGQPAATAERSASRTIAAHYALQWSDVSVRGLAPPRAGEIPGRNDLLVTIARSAAPESSVAIGIHAGVPYFDCSPTWVAAWQAKLDAEHFGAVQLLAPLLHMSKVEVFRLARRLRVPLEAAFSCEASNEPCGSCPSCKDRVGLDAGS